MNTTTRHGPIALNELLDSALNKLTAEPAKPSATRTDGFLFSGNRHDSVPRALLLDMCLTPLERNAWQVFRLMLNDDGITAFPTYEQLRPWLASTPCAGPASYETVARALTILRLTRWLSLVRKRRDPKTGRILGNVYGGRGYFCATVGQMTEEMIKGYLEHHFEPKSNDDFRMEPG